MSNKTRVNAAESSSPGESPRPAGARGRRVVRVVCLLSLAVLVLGAWLARHEIEIVWHRFALESSDPRRSERAAESLLELRDAGSVAAAIRAARRHRYLETHLPRMVETFSARELAPALGELRSVLEGENPFEWMAALEAIEALGEMALPTLPRLMEGYLFWESSPDFGLHHRILTIIADLGPRAAAARPVLKKALQSYDLEAQRLARLALKRTAPAPAAATTSAGKATP